MADIDAPIMCREVRVQPGEMVFGDYDGIVVIPREVEDAALAKVNGENHTRDELLQEWLLGEVYAKYGVL